MTYLISLCCRNVPIVVAHGGGAPYTYSPLNFIYHLPLSFIERKALSYIDRIIVTSKWIYDSLSRFHPNLILFYPFGVDFEEFKPLGKEKARKALGIPLDKKVLLHVGRFDTAKGLDIILKVYQELRNNYDLDLILIGGLKTDPLYHEAVKSGATVREWVPQHELIPYYSAADVYLFPKFYSNRDAGSLEEFMSIGVALIESLACGTPVVGTHLRHFLGDEDELRGIGKIPKNVEDTAQCVSEVIKHPKLYQNCRDIAKKYYGWDVIVEKLINIYDELFRKYYA